MKSDKPMIKSLIYSSIFFMILFPFQMYGQQDSGEFYKQESRALIMKGFQLRSDGNFIEALDTFKLALKYRIKGYGIESSFLGSYYMALGITYKNLGQLNQALFNYEQSEKSYLLRNDSNLISLAHLYINIGNIYRAKLDYQNALNYFNQALNIYLHQNTIDQQNVSNAQYAIAEIYYLQKQDKKTINTVLTNFVNADTLNQIYYYNILAASYQNLFKFSEAEKYSLKSISLTKEFFGNNDIELAFALINYAQLLSKTNRFEEAIKNMEQAFHIIVETQNKIGRDLSHYNRIMGDIFREKPIATQNLLSFRQQKRINLEEAISWYNKSISVLFPETEVIQPDSIDIQKCISFMHCLNSLKDMADTYQELALLDKEEKDNSFVNSLNDAIKYYQNTSKLIQQARREISSDESKIELAGLEYSTFKKTIETAFLAYEITGNDSYFDMAFFNSEQTKSSAIFDKLSNDLAQENSLIPDSLLELEKRLNSTISIYSENIFQENSKSEPDSALLAEYNNKMFKANRDRDEFNRLLEIQYPDYVNLKYSSSMLPVNEIQKLLNKNEVIIEYVYVEHENVTGESKEDTTDVLYTFVIGQNNKRFIKQTVGDVENESLEEVFQFMSTPNYIFTTNEDSKKFCTASNNIYKLLIAPLENELNDKNLVIIPDGKLNYIAFDALLKTMPDTSQMINFSKLDYLLRDKNINYANSTNILMQNRSSGRRLRNNVMAFAPEYKSEKFALSNASYTLMPLPGVKKEVEAIAKTVKTKLFMGEEASEINFRENCSDYDILHLAMHAYINDSLPAFSRLAFSPVASSDDLQKDGWLNTADIYNLDLNAKLTVLSACNTGIGKLQKGEGLMSLARGFLYAGCPSIIMSLWEVEDEAGTKIMTSFYKNLKRGKSKDEALRLAKLQYLENANSRQAHPHYWMSFKSIGDNSPIYASYDIYFFALLIILILAFTVDQTIRIRKVHKRNNTD